MGRFEVAHNDISIDSNNFGFGVGLLKPTLMISGVHANSSAQLRLTVDNSKFFIGGANLQSNENTVVTQDSSHRKLFVPSTTNLDLTESQTDYTSSTNFAKKRSSLPMASFAAKRSTQSKQTANGAKPGYGSSMNLSSSRVDP